MFFFLYVCFQDVCVGIDAGGLCIGGWKTFGTAPLLLLEKFILSLLLHIGLWLIMLKYFPGNHVGDWEHVSLRLQAGLPVELYLGVHRCHTPSSLPKTKP